MILYFKVLTLSYTICIYFKMKYLQIINKNLSFSLILSSSFINYLQEYKSDWFQIKMLIISKYDIIL